MDWLWADEGKDRLRAEVAKGHAKSRVKDGIVLYLMHAHLPSVVASYKINNLNKRCRHSMYAPPHSARVLPQRDFCRLE